MELEQRWGSGAADVGLKAAVCPQKGTSLGLETLIPPDLQRAVKYSSKGRKGEKKKIKTRALEG